MIQIKNKLFEINFSLINFHKPMLIILNLLVPVQKIIVASSGPLRLPCPSSKDHCGQFRDPKIILSHFKRLFWSVSDPYDYLVPVQKIILVSSGPLRLHCDSNKSFWPIKGRLDYLLTIVADSSLARFPLTILNYIIPVCSGRL